MKARSKRHPKPARPHDPNDDEAHDTEAQPLSDGEGRVNPTQKLKAMNRRLERVAVIADIVNALADLFRL